LDSGKDKFAVCWLPGYAYKQDGMREVLHKRYVSVNYIAQYKCITHSIPLFDL